MKQNLLFLLLALLFAACSEIPPVITPFTGEPGNTSSDIENQQRQVLIEEFTGVRCVQCPAGSAEIETLLAIHGERLVAVSIHAGDFSPPFPQSLYDFRTPEGTALINFLGPPIAYPSAVVNRRKFEGKNSLILGRNDWAGFIEQEKALPPKVKIALEPKFNAGNRKLELEVKLYPQEDILDPDIRISVMLTESGIVDYQETPGAGKVPDYVHKHALRKSITSALGDIVAETMASGAIITKNYSYTLPENWNAEKMKAIAFVHLGGNVKDVLQAIEVSVVK
jgi:hypothetical protein